MKKLNQFPLAMLIASAAVSILSVVMRIVLTATQLDAKYGVYRHDAIGDDIYHIILAAACVLLVAAAILKAPKWPADFSPKTPDITVFLASASGFMLLGFILLSVLDIMTSGSGFKPLDIFEMVFAVPASVYFLFLTKRSTERKPAVAAASFFTVAWCAVCLIRIYFDVSVLNVSPNKIIGMLALLAAMTAFLSESRLALGAVNHRLSLAALSTAPVLLLTSGLPNIIMASKLSIGASDRFVVYIIEVIFALFFWSRLIAYAKYEETPAAPAADTERKDETK